MTGKKILLTLFLFSAFLISQESKKYVIVHTGQTDAYNNSSKINLPVESQAFFGQDANYQINMPSYQDNGDGTITDLVTGLMWQKSVGNKMTFQQAKDGAASFNAGGYTDWRLPTIKELYSLILFSGQDPSGFTGTNTENLTPFIDNQYFDFEYGDTDNGERIIDAQYASITEYVHYTMNGDETMFGVNFADGRIKGYGISLHGTDKNFFVKYVRGNADYGKNEFVNNGDNTITDKATGLMWMKLDSGGMNQGTNGNISWEAALEWAENLTYAGYDDWRLPTVKELQSIIDYSRSPATTNSAAIDPLFTTTKITAEDNSEDYGFYWSGTTHAKFTGAGDAAAYVSFGRAYGWMQDPQQQYNLLDVHGAGAQRSDPKTGDPADYPNGHGPQGDVIRIYNLARLVRTDTAATVVSVSSPTDFNAIQINLLEEVKLSWTDNSDNETGFRIKRIQDSNEVLFELPANTTSFTDTTVKNAKTYRYTIQSFNDQVTSEWTPEIEIQIDGTVAINPSVPFTFNLEPNYPNPFNPSTKIRYSVGETSSVSLKVYNILGEIIQILVDEEKEAGQYSKTFDASGLPSGIYFLRMTSSSGFDEKIKMQLIK